ncbi:MAG: hypothetical protein JWM14_1561 [Chitinophagaceae bacterium]|nr:hypothetical protein [Chitinophagaceae bacterium]
MKKLTFTKQVLILFFLGCFNLAFAGGGGHGIFPLCKDMHIEASRDWYPGVTVEYNVNYSENSGGANQTWDITGGTIIAVNGNALPTGSVPYNGLTYSVTKIFSEKVPSFDFKDPNNLTVDVNSNLYATLLGIATSYFRPETNNPYVKITVKWDANASYASIYCRSNGMGLSGVCGSGEEKKEFWKDCVDNNNSIALVSDQTIIPSCSNGGHFRFVINSNVKNSNISWTLPSNWYIYSGSTNSGFTTRSGKDVFAVEGYATFNGDVSKLGGQVSVNVTRLCNGGVARFSHYIIPENFSANITSPIQICPYIPDAPVNVTVTGVEPFSYVWSKNKVSSACTSGNGCPTMIYSTNEIMNENLSVKVSSGACFTTANVQWTKVDPNAAWTAYQIFNNFVPEALAIDVNATSDFSQHTDILTDQVGLPYYTAQNGLIYTYEYVTTPYVGWKNKSISTATTATLAKGPMAIYEPTPGNKTIYYLNASALISKVTSSGTTWTTSPVFGPVGVARSIKVNSSNQLFYINTNNQIYGAVNNYATPLATVLAGTKMTITNNYVYYFNTSGQIEAINYTISPYTPITFSAANSDSKVFSGYNLTYFAWQNYSDIEADVAGNVYYVGATNSLYKVNASTNTLSKVSSFIKYNGFLNTGQQAGVVYAGSIDNNIYQYAASNGDSPIEISFVGGNKTWPIGSSSYSGWWGQQGAIRFRAPNVFYLSADGRVKMISYNTSNFCTPNVLRQSNEPMEPSAQSINEELQDENNFSVQPNPLVASSTINYKIPSTSDVKIILYNSMGDVVNTVIEVQNQEAGTYTYSLENTNLPKGLLICQFYVNGQKRKQIKVLNN